jgi:hypothetical protein
MRLAADLEEKITVSKEIDLVQLRLDEMVSQLDSSESLKTWEETREVWKKLQEANKRKDSQASYQLTQKLERLFAQGATPHQKFQELFRVIQTRAKLVLREARIISDRRKSVSLESVLGFARAMGIALRETVSNQAERQKLVERMSQLLRWDGEKNQADNSEPKENCGQPQKGK